MAVRMDFESSLPVVVVAVVVVVVGDWRVERASSAVAKEEAVVLSEMALCTF